LSYGGPFDCRPGWTGLTSGNSSVCAAGWSAGG